LTSVHITMIYSGFQPACWDNGLARVLHTVFVLGTRVLHGITQ